MTPTEPIKAVCCVCGVTYRDGVEIDGHVSHGYCPVCLDAEMQKIKNMKAKP